MNRPKTSTFSFYCLALKYILQITELAIPICLLRATLIYLPFDHLIKNISLDLNRLGHLAVDIIKVSENILTTAKLKDAYDI
jgi:hypothetical protein